MSDDPSELISRAEQIADEVLFTNALDADAAGTVPEKQLQCMADGGFFGVSTACDAATIAELIEIFASGCLTTTFVWTQHLGSSAAAFFSERPELHALGAEMASGNKRGGVAFAHMLRPGIPMTTATPDGDGWKLNGIAPWVTGWGHIDLVHAAARHGDDIVWTLIDAVDSPTLTSEQVRFSVVDSTQTDVLTYVDHRVPAERVTKVENYDDWRARYRLGLRPNGSLALGVARRCCRLLEDDAFDARLAEVRGDLNRADPADHDAMTRARAAASLFAVTAATALVAKTGGSAVMSNNHAQRLMREATFVLVQGQTPAIKAEMLTSLAGH